MVVVVLLFLLLFHCLASLLLAKLQFEMLCAPACRKQVLDVLQVYSRYIAIAISTINCFWFATSVFCCVVLVDVSATAAAAVTAL